MFVFTLKDSIPLKFELSQSFISDAIVRIYNPSDAILLRIGKDIWISKKGIVSSCYQNQRSTFDYLKYSNALINVSGPGCCEINQIYVIEMM